MKIVAGIDYSMTSPAICIHHSDTWGIQNCLFFFRTSVKKMELKIPMFEGTLAQPYICEEERFYNNALWAEGILKEFEPTFVALEGYAMGAKGKVFHIGENTALLKHIMWRNKMPFVVPPPTVIKKFATGKGNANKEAMEAAFMLETLCDVRKLVGQSELSNNPSSDLIDAYYMCKYAFENQK